MKLYPFLLLLILQSCSISGGLGVHDVSFDSEYEEDNIIGWVQGDISITDSINFYGRHESMPLIYNDTGLNSVGVSIRYKLID